MYGFPIRPMDVDIAYAASANTRAPLFLALRVRVPLPFGGHIHLAAPRLYQLFCPVTKVLRGPFMPDCTQEDPILTGCYGLPSPNDPDPPWGLPLCDPMHEVLLTWSRPKDRPLPANLSLATRKDIYALEVDEPIFMSIRVRVPTETPRPRSENTFRIRLLDESKIIFDGRLNEFGNDVVNEPRVQDVSLWWDAAW